MRISPPNEPMSANPMSSATMSTTAGRRGASAVAAGPATCRAQDEGRKHRARAMDRRGGERHLLSRRSRCLSEFRRISLIVDRAAFALDPPSPSTTSPDPTAAGSGIDEFALDAVQLPSQPPPSRGA